MELTTKAGVYFLRNVEDDTYADLIREGWKSPENRDGLGQFKSVEANCWFTSKPSLAARYAKFATDPELKRRLERRHFNRVEKIRPSFAITSDVKVPVPPGLELRPYQRAGVAYGMIRDRVGIFDSMRLGKTIQAIGLANIWDVKNVLIVCPATAKINWQREWDKWNTLNLPCVVFKPGSQKKTPNHRDAPVVIANYEMVANYDNLFREQVWDMIVFDESHYLKNENSKRTRACLGTRDAHGDQNKTHLPGKRLVFLDGTPKYTRTIDLWPICRVCDPLGVGASWWSFVNRYCDAKKDENGNWDFGGSSNLEELQERMRIAFMIRREKTDVAKEIPPNRQTFVIPKDGLTQLVTAERKAFGEDNRSAFDHMYAAVQAGEDVSDIMYRLSAFDGIDRSEFGGDGDPEAPVPMSTARKNLALAKIPHVIEYMRELLGSVDKVVLFAHHREVVEALHTAFELTHNAVKLYGGMTPTNRQAAIDTFRNDPKCRVFVGNILSAGQAINLSVADDVVFAELSWVPAEMDQAEERVWDVLKEVGVSIHRIVVEDSLDEAMCFVLDRRQKETKKTLHVRALLDSVNNVGV